MTKTILNSKSIAIRTTLISILSSTLLALIKGLSGYFGNSFALIADAIESTVDIFASVLVLLGLYYANKPADKNHPYGHGRAEPLITFIVVAFLVFSALIIAIQSIENIQTPHQLPAPWTLWVLALIILWKEISFRLVMKRAIQTNSSALKSDAWHHRSDAITSIAAFLGISIALFLGDGFQAADDWAALFAAGFILYNAFLIFRPALGEVMDEHVYDDVVEDIKRIAKDVAGLKAIKSCYIRKVGMYYHVDIDAFVDGEISVKKGHEIAHQLEDLLKQEITQIHALQIHIEPYKASH